MKHIFVINPASGKGVEAVPLSEAIRDACEAAGADFEIYLTKAAHDATDFVRARIADKPDGEVRRFYACGGDGTLSEVIAGAANPDAADRPGSIPGVEVGCLPIGTGNDFVRNFTSPEFFRDVTKQLLADAMEIDCYRCEVGGITRIAVNMINIGFDADVVVKAGEFKKKRWLPKRLAYIAGILSIFRRNEGKTITVRRADGGEVTHEFQLVSAANGGWCGGGFHSAPKSSLTDGLLDISLIRKVSRLDFLRLVGSYKKGTHLETRLGKKVVAYIKEPSVAFTLTEDANICIDGEIYRARGLSLAIMPRAVAFVVPVGCVYIE
ncbi:MAG: hypothetical protein IJF67_12740 [Clostridia bacterium]|nr:hypothetical protein [Clostridia bacterium]